MLIFNDCPATPPTSIQAEDNITFFRSVVGELSANGPAILLVGGADFASWTVRSQQALLRFDRRPSDYSHAALVCEWNRSAPEESWGFEIDPVRVGAALQQPEYAGVTPFRLRDYLDTGAYPNLAVVDVPLSPERTQKVLDAARTPTRDTMRFPLMRWLATWRAFVSCPEAVPHPLLNRVPHPGAAYIGLAYEAADVALIPGATDLQHCPELLWANAKHWGHMVGDNVHVLRVVRDRHAIAPDARALPMPAPSEESPRVAAEGPAARS